MCEVHAVASDKDAHGINDGFRLAMAILDRSPKSIPWVGTHLDLGLAESTRHNWVSQYRKHGTQSFEPKELTPHEQEIIALRKRLADVSMERDILKKAIAIFSRKK